MGVASCIGAPLYLSAVTGLFFDKVFAILQYVIRLSESAVARVASQVSAVALPSLRYGRNDSSQLLAYRTAFRYRVTRDEQSTFRTPRELSLNLGPDATASSHPVEDYKINCLFEGVR